MIPSTWKKVKPSGQYHRNVSKEYKKLMTKNKRPVQIVRSLRRPNQISSTTKDDESPTVNVTATTSTIADNNTTAPVLAIIESASADASQISDALPSTSSFSSRQLYSEASIDSPQASDDSFGLCTYIKKNTNIRPYDNVKLN